MILGEVSFSVYLFHTIILRYYQQFPGLVVPDQAGFWRLLYWATVLAISYLAYELVEKPAQMIIMRRDKPHRGRSQRGRYVLLAVSAAMLAAGLAVPRLT